MNQEYQSSKNSIEIEKFSTLVRDIQGKNGIQITNKIKQESLN